MTHLPLGETAPTYPVPPSYLSAPHAWSMTFTVVCLGFWLLALISGRPAGRPRREIGARVPRRRLVHGIA